MTAVTEVLYNPDILTIIFRFLTRTLNCREDLRNHDIQNCIQVNSKWYYTAVPLFWRETDIASFVLEFLGRPDRLQFYANYIQKLSFNECNSTSQESANDLKSRYNRLETICQDIQLPRLQILDLKDTKERFQFPQSWLKNDLQAIKLTSLYRDPELFHSINRCQHLTTFHIEFGEEYREESPPLAEQYWLENFELFKRCFTPLANISTLHLGSVNVDGLQDVLANLPKLHSLGIEAHEFDQVINVVIENCVGLHCLQVLSYGYGSVHGHILESHDSYLHGHNIINLADAFPDLQVLVLFGILRGVKFYLSDDDIESMARRLPNLQVLCIDTNEDLRLAEDRPRLTGKSLQSIGTYCKKLRYCKLRCSICFDTFVRDVDRDLFPRLEKLHINRPRWSQEDLNTNLELARNILQIFTELRKLSFSNGWLFWHSSKKPQLEIDVNNLIARPYDWRRWEWAEAECICDLS